MATSTKFTQFSLRTLEKFYLNCVLKRTFASGASYAKCLNNLQQQHPADCLSHKHARFPQRTLFTHRCCASQTYCTEAQISAPIVEDSDEPDILYKKLLIEVKCHDRKVLHSYEQYVRETTLQLELNLAGIRSPKVNIFRQAVLASSHVYKKHQVQYEERTYYRVFEEYLYTSLHEPFKHLTGSTADTLLEYLQRNLPEGMAMKVTRHQVLPMPPHLRPPTQAKQIDS